MIYTATYSPEDNKLRLYSVSRLDSETYARVKAAGFIWAPKQGFFVAPMWTPSREDLLIELAGEIGDEDTTLVDRAEERADRFSDYSQHRAKDADQARKAVSAIADNIPLGQPILVGHHSEKHARKDAERIENGMRRSIKMWEQSCYWKERAAGAIRHAKYKERADVRARRIKGLDADQRSRERDKAKCETGIKQWSAEGLTQERAELIANYNHLSKCFTLAEYPREVPASQYEGEMSLWSALHDGIITPEQARDLALPSYRGTIAWCDRWLQHIGNRLEYERAMLAEAGGLAADRVDIQLGGRVMRDRGEWVTILRINRKDGKIVSVSTNARYCKVVSIEEIRDYQPPTEQQAQAVKAAVKLPPMCNYPGEGFHHVSRATWDKKYHDMKGSRIVPASDKYGEHRVRSGMFVGGYNSVLVYIEDAKRVDPPAPKATPAEPAPKIQAPTREPVEREWKEPTVEPQAEAFDAMRETLKAGVKVVSAPQLFPTPPALARRMVELAGMPFAESSLRILEPSAGTGAIINEIFTYAGEIHAIEINPTLAEELRRRWPAVKVRCSDFLECVDQTGFDFILMNPPFANGEDIKHIKHALTMLRPGGRLVAICANGPRQNEQLKPLVDEAGGEWEVLPPDTFKESGTGVNTVLLVMDADPEDDEPDPQPTAAPPDFGKGIFLATPDVDNRPIGQRAQPLPSMAPHIEEQKKVAAQRAGQNLTEQFNRPPKDITSKAGELERRAPLFHDTEASGQTRLF